MALDHEFRTEWLLVRIGNPREVANFTIQGFAVETFDVAFDQSVERAFNINLDEAVMLGARSCLEKPKPLDKFVRTSSPSSTSTRCPRCRKSSATRLANDDLPAPERPVNQRVKPSLICSK